MPSFSYITPIFPEIFLILTFDSTYSIITKTTKTRISLEREQRREKDTNDHPSLF